MTRDEIEELYFEYMYGLVCSGRRASYRKLLSFLHSREFIYIIPMDSNRFEDGIDLRYRFGYDNDIPQYMIANLLDTRPCSVLEMMVALCVRCEESIMDDPEIGDRTGVWFFEMLESLGLRSMSDSRFVKKRADMILDIFLERKYENNGKGGLFTIPNYDGYMQEIEIWQQMMRRLNDLPLTSE